MAKLALGIAIVLMLATAFFNFKLKDMMTDMRSNLTEAKTKADGAEGTVAKAKAEAKAAQEQLIAANARADAATAEATAARTGNQPMVDQVKALQEKAVVDQAEIARLNVLVTTGGNAAPDTGELTRLQAELKTALAKAAEAQQINSSLQDKAKAAESEAATYRQKEERRVSGTLRPGLEGTVLAVQPGFNFVVLSLGDRQGAVMNAEMIVMRGGQRVAKVRITSVEPSTSVADIVPGSAGRGVRVQPGDRVIFPGG